MTRHQGECQCQTERFDVGETRLDPPEPLVVSTHADIFGFVCPGFMISVSTPDTLEVNGIVFVALTNAILVLSLLWCCTEKLPSSLRVKAYTTHIQGLTPSSYSLPMFPRIHLDCVQKSQTKPAKIKLKLSAWVNVVIKCFFVLFCNLGESTLETRCFL